MKEKNSQNLINSVIPIPGGGTINLSTTDWITSLKSGQTITLISNGKPVRIKGEGTTAYINGYQVTDFINVLLEFMKSCVI